MTSPSGSGPHRVRVVRSDYRWRARLRRDPRTRGPYRLAVAVTGVSVVVLGLLLVPLPGPGWFIVIGGLLILASEFAWARRLLDFVKRNLTRWNELVMAQPVGIRVLIGALALLGLLVVVWGVAAVIGAPAWLSTLLPGV